MLKLDAVILTGIGVDGRAGSQEVHRVGGRVIADVEVPGLGDYFVGERTRVYVSTGTRQTLIVPRASVFERAGVEYVRLTDNRDIIVKLGEARDDKVEILSGLKAGDRVVIQ